MSARKPARKKSQDSSAFAALLRSPTTARRAGWVLLWGLTFGGAAYGLHRLEPVAFQALSDGSWHIEWVEPPIWFDSIAPLVQADAERAARTLESLTVRDADLLANVHDILQVSPWIAEIRKITKQADGAILVDARFRKPLTRVDVGTLGFLVDDEGFLLPGVTKLDFRKPDEFVHVEQAYFQPPEPGLQWHGEDIQAGLALVKFLQANAPPALLMELHAVSDRPTGGEATGPLRIRTIRDNYILWGLPPGAEYDMEATAAAKLETLTALFRQHGGRIHGDEIDIRGKDASVLNWPRSARGPR